jgi:hypothetical protein
MRIVKDVAGNGAAGGAKNVANGFAGYPVCIGVGKDEGFGRAKFFHDQRQVTNRAVTDQNIAGRCVTGHTDTGGIMKLLRSIVFHRKSPQIDYTTAVKIINLSIFC